MRLSALNIQNFRAIGSLALRDLGDAVVLAGPNGCGKSCVLDSIRLLKSVYGSYQQDEWQHWLGEFQINLNKEAEELLTLFQDRTRELRIAATFILSDAERDFLSLNARALLEEKTWRELTPDTARGRRASGSGIAADQRINRPRANRVIADTLPDIQRALVAQSQSALVTLQPLGRTEFQPNALLELIFSTYEPQHLGVIDYHGPHRNYNRERAGNINLNIESSEQRLRQHALYNYGNKYANLKTEMASAYVRHLLARQANPDVAPDDALTTTLKELFATFFPGKVFLGPQPTSDGRLLFPVRLEGGAEHDIDELSSGEKEVLYGYLRLHNAAPRHSILMIDEPELHLNPRLVSGLAAFYYRHLGSRLDNQLWLVTHSDTLIREAVNQQHFDVFHIHPAGAMPAEQATPVRAKEEVERVVIALVGDLAAYRPNAKIVVFESTADAAFDMRMTCTLFPEFEQRVNAISAGDKRRVADLYNLLDVARAAGHLADRFYAITDSDGETGVAPSRRYCWDVYHIENYLLEPVYLLDALRTIGIRIETLANEEQLLSSLKSIAASTTPALVAHRLRGYVNERMVGTIDLGIDPSRTDVGAALSESIQRCSARLSRVLREELSEHALVEIEREYTLECETALEDGTWKSQFRGRDILRRFAGEHAHGMTYEYFRDLVISRMSEGGHRPPGMQTIVGAILAD